MSKGQSPASAFVCVRMCERVRVCEGESKAG